MKIPIITFEDCDTPEKFEKLKAFALNFDPPHELRETKHRIVIAKRDGIWIGYAEVITTPIVCSAWSKDACKPQDIWGAMMALAGWSRMQHGEGYVMVPLNTKTFPEHIMSKLGFYRTNSELYKTL